MVALPNTNIFNLKIRKNTFRQQYGFALNRLHQNVSFIKIYVLLLILVILQKPLLYLSMSLLLLQIPVEIKLWQLRKHNYWGNVLQLLEQTTSWTNLVLHNLVKQFPTQMLPMINTNEYGPLSLWCSAWILLGSKRLEAWANRSNSYKCFIWAVAFGQSETYSEKKEKELNEFWSTS